jgi:hypothetical protein
LRRAERLGSAAPSREKNRGIRLSCRASTERASLCVLPVVGPFSAFCPSVLRPAARPAPTIKTPIRPTIRARPVMTCSGQAAFRHRRRRRSPVRAIADRPAQVYACRVSASSREHNRDKLIVWPLAERRASRAPGGILRTLQKGHCPVVSVSAAEAIKGGLKQVIGRPSRDREQGHRRTKFQVVG